MSHERHLMPANPLHVTPRFKIGHRVTIAFPSHYWGHHGFILEVIDHKGNFIYRYHVRLTDGETATIFEFELTLL